MNFPPRHNTHYPSAPGYKERGGASAEAAARAEPTAKLVREKIVALLKQSGAMTYKEIARATGMNRDSVKPRLSELFTQGVLEKVTDERRERCTPYRIRGTTDD